MLFLSLLIKMHALLAYYTDGIYVICLATVGAMRFLCVASAAHFFIIYGKVNLTKFCEMT